MFKRLTLCLVVGLSLATSPVHAAKENFDRSKPHLSFFVHSPGLDFSNFEVIAGLGVEVEVIEDRDGEDPVVRKRPGRVKYGDITLKRGYRGQQDLEAWAWRATRGRAERRDITITILDRTSETLRTIDFHEAFPTVWRLDSNDDGELVETFTFAAERVELHRQ